MLASCRPWRAKDANPELDSTSRLGRPCGCVWRSWLDGYVIRVWLEWCGVRPRLVWGSLGWVRWLVGYRWVRRQGKGQETRERGKGDAGVVTGLGGCWHWGSEVRA